MKAKLVKIVKNRLADIVLIVAIFLVFFLTGKSNNTQDPKTPTNQTQDLPTNQIDNKDTMAPVSETPPIVTENEKNNTSTGIVKTTEDPLSESMKNLKVRDVSTNDIVDRNAYFNKLTQQLNQLQGQTNSEEDGTNSKNTSGEEEDEDFIHDAEEVAEEVFENDNQQTLPPPQEQTNPYRGLENLGPQSPPQVIE